MPPVSTAPIAGTCDPRFENVRDVFAQNFAERGDTGGGVGVVVGGRVVVDLVGGFVDKAQTRAWDDQTLVNVASTTKGFLATAIHRLVDQGKLDLDAPVLRYWPEFAQGGKGEITTRSILAHRAGLAAVRETLPAEALFAWETVAGALAAQEPLWPPGTQHGYHAMTIGWLLGEIVRRVTGRTFGRWFADEIARPLGLDLHIGLTPAEEARAADVRGTRPSPGESAFLERILREPQSLSARAFLNPQVVLTPAMLSSHPWRAAELPFANGHATAGSIARFYGALATRDPRLLSSESIDRARTEHSYGPDLVLGETTRFGLGFMLSHPGAPLGASPNAFGHPGAGGSLGFADPEAGVGFGYVTCKLGNHLLIDPRARALADAVYAAL